MTKVAEKRLRSVLDLNQLGAGFDISERDLDIRRTPDQVQQQLVVIARVERIDVELRSHRDLVTLLR